MKQRLNWERNFLFVAVGLTLGFLISIQVKTLLSQPENITSMRAPVLAERLLNIQEENRKLRNEIDKLRQQILRYEKAMAEGRTATESLTSDLKRLRVLAGLTQVKGAGILIWLTDAEKPIEGVDPTVGIVHDTDLLILVNELKAAGAEAIAINDQRVVTTTSIRCVGPLITVNGVSISPPYEITAIGDPDKLEKALTMPNGALAGLRIMGIPVRITRHENLIIPSLSVTPMLKFAKPSQQ